MSGLSPDGQRMVQALRSERMSPDERARLRARVLGSAAAAATLAAAGTAASQAGAGAVASAAGATQTATLGTAAAAAVAAPVSVGAKVAGAGLLWKLGVASALVVASVPVTQSLVQTRAPAARTVQHEPAARNPRLRAPARAHEGAAEPTVSQVEPAGLVEAARPTEPRAALTELAPVEPAPPPADVERAPARAPAARALAPTKPRVSVAAPVEASLAEPAAPASSLRAESELLEQALEAERDGQLEQARAALERHALRYPHGLLAPERERVRARLKL
jgi:hypothetical protein